MTVLMTDFEIEAEIRRVETEIEKWVRSRDLWGDCGFSQLQRLLRCRTMARFTSGDDFCL